MIKKLFISICLLPAVVFLAGAQTGTWSGKIDVQGIQLPLVFHLDDEKPTMDSPDQGVRGVPTEVERTATGALKIKIPSIGASYEGQWLIKQIVGTFKQRGVSFPLTLTPGEEALRRPQTPAAPFPYAQEEVSFANGDALLDKAYAALAAGTPLPSADKAGLPAALKQNYQAAMMQLRTPYMRYFLALDTRPLLGRIHCPVLALNGSKDLQVEPESNLGALKAGLPANPLTRIQRVDGVNHLFQHCATGAATEYKSIEETFAPEVLERMALWIADAGK